LLSRLPSQRETDLARWLHERRITSLGDCTQDVWRGYLSERWNGGVSREYAEEICTYLSDLWAFDQLSANPAGIARPPWEAEGVDDFLPAADGSARGENGTEPLDPQVLCPLLIWAIRFVDDFADDILAAWAERHRLTAMADTNKPSPQSRTALEKFLLPRLQPGATLPAVRMHGQMRLARTYISALTGASLGQVEWFTARHHLRALVNERPGPCPLPIQVTGRIGGRLRPPCANNCAMTVSICTAIWFRTADDGRAPLNPPSFVSP
jgi:hypothetical protein